jgi:thiopurine S-methyltransferase
MEHDFWHERWQNGQIGFHSPDVHWALAKHWPTLTPHLDEPVLVPLCGKSLDMRWLADRGHPVTGIELNSIAVEEFFADWAQTPQPVDSPHHELPGSMADRVTLWQGDFFGYIPEAGYSLFYDRAALIALPPRMRPSYMSHLRRCLKIGAIGLLVTLEYDQNQKYGPPFSVDHQEISGYGMFDIEPLERRDVLAANSKFAQSGVTSLHETVYRLVAV